MNGALEPERPRRTIPAAVQWSMIVVSIVLACAVSAANLFGLVAGAGAVTGILTPGDLVTVAVEPGSAAARAGVRSGDRIDWAAMPLHDRLLISEGIGLAGAPVRIVVRRDGAERSFAFSLPPLPVTAARVAQRATAFAAALFALTLGAVVLLRAPTGDAVAFWLFSLAWVPGVLWKVAAMVGSDAANVVIDVALSDVLQVAFVTGGIVLALRAAGPSPHRARYERLAFAAGLGVVAVVLSSDVGLVLLGRVPPPAVQWFEQSLLLFYVGYAASAAIVVAEMVRTRGAARVRLQWFAFGFGAYFLGVVLTSIAQIPAFAVSDWFSLATAALFALGLLLFAYPIVRHDVFGVGFFINRAAIYAVVTGVVVGAFAGGNWLIGTALKSAGLALPVDVVLAAIAGLSLNVVQRRVNRIVDRVLFRRRYEAARRLRRVARALGQAPDDEFVAQALVVEPCEALELHAAAYFTRGADGAFERVAAYGWPPDAPAVIDAKDRFVLHVIGAGDAPLRLDSVPHTVAFPHGAPRPRVAFPLWSRRELAGVALYSTHRNGAMLDPEEIEEIERIIAAAAAFDRESAAQLRRAREELAALRAEHARVVERLGGAIV